MGKRTVVVTGGAGFIGSNLVRHLLASGRYRVVNLDLLTYAGNLDSLADVAGSPDYRFVRGDIGDGKLVSGLLAEERPSAILNLAAESHVDRSIDDPGAFVRTNVVGTCTLLAGALAYWRGLPEEAAAAFRFLHVSTDEVFGTLGPEGRFTETTPYAPNSPYAASKAASDHFVRAYRETYRLPALITNCSNNYGPRQFPEKLIPLVIEKCLAREPIPVYGDGAQVRDWLYVDDHCAGIVLALERGRPGESYNIGGHGEKSNLEVVRTICAAMDAHRPGSASHDRLISFVADRPGHDRRYAIDPAKIEGELGWRPAVTFDEGIGRTVDWYLANRSWIDRIAAGTYRGERLGLDRNGSNR